MEKLILHDKIQACATDSEQCMIVISADRMGDDNDDRKDKQLDLAHDIKRADFGFMQVSGGFVEDIDATKNDEADEKLYLIFFKSDRRTDAFEYFKKVCEIYEQNSFLFVENGKVNYLDKNGTNVLKQEDFLPEKLETYFAKLKNISQFSLAINAIDEDFRGLNGLLPTERRSAEAMIAKFKKGEYTPSGFLYYKGIREKMEYLISDMARSPLFQLSLSSKELFHSNFIYWIGKQYKKEFSNFWKEVLKSDDIEIKSIEREKQNIDLTINLENGRKIIVENKVKSVPTKSQLEMYGAKHENCDFVLLSVADNTDIAKETKGWKFISYKELKEKFLYKIKTCGMRYEEELIRDYCRVIDFMTGVFEHLNKEYDKPYLEFIGRTKNKILEDLKEVRFSDAYLKHFTQLMVRNIQKKIKETFKNKETFIANKIQAVDGMKVGDIVLEYGFTRSQPLVTMGFLLSKNENSNRFLSVQIQGVQMRMVVCEDVPKDKRSSLDVFDIAKKLQEHNLWISEETVKEILKIDEATLLGDGKDKTGFNSYAKKFVYKYVDLSKVKPSIINKEIEDMFIDTIKYIEENKEKLTKIILTN